MSDPKTWNPEVILQLTDAVPPMTPLNHQVAAWEAMSKHFLDHKHQAGMVVMPTGAGKTVTAGNWMLKHHVSSGGRVLWLAHRRGLLRQAFRCIQQLGNSAYPKTELGMIAVSSNDASLSMVAQEHDVVFLTMQSAVQQGAQDFLEVFVQDSLKGTFVVVDEAHHAAAPSYRKLLRWLKERGCKLLGLTATPVRADHEDQHRLAALFDETIVYQVNRQQLIDQNILAVPSFETVKTRVEVEREFTREDYRQLRQFGDIGPKVLKRLAKNASRNQLIVERYVKNQDRYGPTIVFAADTAHCVTLTEEFRKAGVDADYVAYWRPDVATVIARYQEQRQPDVLINAEMLTEGFDAPHTRTVFVARPTRSEVLLTQMVGRALRGTVAGGNELAHLVTFMDTWEEFNVLDARYVLNGDEAGEEARQPPPSSTSRVSIPLEMIHAAYRLVVNCYTPHMEGVFQCLPHGWYIWWDTFEDDHQQRTVMIFENQCEGYETLLADAEPAGTAEEATEERARALIRRYFADVPDPLPRWTDVQALLDAKRKGCEIHRYTFDEKRRFDPKVLAAQVVDQAMPPLAKREFLEGVWTEIPACRFVYRDDFHAMLEDVSREENLIVQPPPLPIEPAVQQLVPTSAPRPWAEGQPGYDLAAIRDRVLRVPGHFPNGSPRLGELRWMQKVSKRYFGFCWYADSNIVVNPVLNSPDVPLLVLEFLIYHELLHADMPYAGHNADFRARERLFQPTTEAVEQARQAGIPAATTPGIWRARAQGFLHTFEKRWIMAVPGMQMVF